ncbi:filamin-binding LIM protein 1 [Chanos chanos]|uniref:Filamin-binding LIM protein 1 n=1 Tax=Chanos chanos TaxID=29144 RepID=A0A6J2VSM5_CHACN|nr:filamin-binding LIM protein 1 [Chanos chanos]
MTSAEPQKKMVSSVFITLASPYRATITQRPHIQHSTVEKDTQQSAVPVSHGNDFSEMKLANTHKKAAALSQDGHNGLQTSPLAPTSPRNSQPGSTLGSSVSGTETYPSSMVVPGSFTSRNTELLTSKVDDNTEEILPPPPPLPTPLDSELSEDPTAPLPPPPVHGFSPAPLQSVPQHGPLSAKFETKTAAKQQEDTPPPGGVKHNEATVAPHSNLEQEVHPESKDVCGFCRKTVALSEPAIEALNRTYHASCFQCRQCEVPLAGKIYYNKAGIPLCEDCYQASLEPCWACGEVIKDHMIRALERAYHPPCFVCTTCNQAIGEQRFAQGEVGEVYCLQDYYRKYAPQCSVCAQLIIPREDGTDSYTVECLGRSFHEDCYRCEVCKVLLSPEPNEQGCHPLEGQILCKPCHLTLVQAVQH